ncbi:MAG TPA: AAA family ATPase [Sporichthyaceae bacterium]|jgi:DNA-binding CsgD family transcriptional regulator|nr:AAA family ATPase [Sporichthyaceae bacterium]
MLLGRQPECEVLDRLLAAARAGHGGAIVVHGEPGIGKTALLEYAISAATDFRVLRATGIEAEVELPFAGLHQMCSPDPSALDALPEPQRIALQVATGRIAGPVPDRLLIGLAALNMTCQPAGGRPLLCIVDDTQWLDRDSAQAFAFVARRLANEPIAFVFGTRVVADAVRGLPELLVEGLAERPAMTLLCSMLPNRVDEPVLERFVAETRGNPLALLELPRGLTPAQLAGGFALPVTVPLTGRIEAGFRRRLIKLPAASRRLMLIAAAEPTGNPVLLWRAAESMGIDESAATAIEKEGLLDLDAQIVFRHPLVRSAVYGAASAQERRAAHRALADATDAALDPDRRAWHLAQATLRPDDAVADDLERSAGRAQARGGFAAAAAFMQRSVELTVDRSRRASRALAAAEAKRQAGALEEALSLANLAQQEPLDDFQRVQVEMLRARVAFALDRGGAAPSLLLDAARRLEAHDPALARETYLDALAATLFAGGFATVCSPGDVAKVALAAPRPVTGARPVDLLLEGLARLLAEGPAVGTAPLRRALEAFRGDAVDIRESLRWTWLAGRAAAFIWDYDNWDALTARQIKLARDAGALAVLPLTLSSRAGVHLVAGEVAAAASLVEQVEAVADATDIRTAPYAAVLVAALRGHRAEALELIGTNLADCAARGEYMGVTGMRWATAVLHNGIGRYADAFDAAATALEDPFGLWFAPWAPVEYIEAAARTGRTAAAALVLERLTARTAASGTVWASAVEDRCRALVSEGPAAEALYRAAIDRLTPTTLRLDLARTRLLYGEWLRRERRNLEARDQLCVAHQMFSEFGTHGFAERARVELRAVGGRTRKPTVGVANDLTPQEEQISRLVAQGMTNLEIAGQLFLSPSTVEYHLHKVFRKLGVKTRTQLARHSLEAQARRE